MKLVINLPEFEISEAQAGRIANDVLTSLSLYAPGDYTKSIREMAEIDFLKDSVIVSFAGVAIARVTFK